MKKTALLSAFILCAILLCSCALNLTEQDGKLIDKKNGITYLPAPICFEPVRTDEELYAKSKTLELYPITGLDTSEWISEPYDGIGGVWYSDKLTLPTLEEFEANKIYICVESTITTALGQVTEQSDVDAVVNAFMTGEKVSVPDSGKSYKLKFESEKYHGIYYNLLFIAKPMEGERTIALDPDDPDSELKTVPYYYYDCFLYDRSTKTCVKIGNELEKYLSFNTEASS